MKKLEDIPKKKLFEAPEGYFDLLPGIIQSRISEGTGVVRWNLSVRPMLRYALPCLCLVVLTIFWYSHVSIGAAKIETELASISPGDLAAYLEEADVTTDDLVENVAWNSRDLKELENSVYGDLELPHQDVERILNDYDDEL